jgi:hypothetical protein
MNEKYTNGIMKGRIIEKIIHINDDVLKIAPFRLYSAHITIRIDRIRIIIIKTGKRLLCSLFTTNSI